MSTATHGLRSQLEHHKDVCVASTHLMAAGEFEDFVELIHPDCVNREAKDEPPESRGVGPAPIYATALWLRNAFAELRFTIHDVVAEGDLVVLHCTMSGRHVNTFLGYDEHAQVKEAFPPTGRTFASTQTHWFRMADGQVIEHWANRDDLATALQLGWVPPTPIYLIRMALAKGRARRLQRRAG